MSEVDQAPRQQALPMRASGRAQPRFGGISPARRALNPILLDAPVVSADGSRASVFFTPTSAVIERRMPLIISGVSGAALLCAYVLSKTADIAPLTHLLTLCAFTVAAIPAASTVWQTVKKLRVNVDVLMLLGAVLAAVIGSPMEGALLLFLFALSGAMEGYALRRTQAAIVSLHNLVPSEAIILTDDGAERIALKRVSVGQRALVRPGDKVPLDGNVVEGSSAVDESPITGESVPRDKTVGDRVYAGTTNLNGRLVIEVTKTSTDTTLARILKLVTEARHRRAGVERLIDRIGPTYSTAVICASLLSGVVLHYAMGMDAREAVFRAIALLIVCSPCALIIATPVAYLSAIGAAARRGILIKGGVFLETFARTKAVVFDKTGTLTTGQVRLAKIIPHDDITEHEALRFAGALESASSHPLAGAVMRELDDRQLQPHPVEQLHSEPGQGISATSNGCRVWIGRPSAGESLIDAPHRDVFNATVESVRRSGKAASALIVDGKPSVLVFEDTLRSNASTTIAQLRRGGIERIEMLTGDHAVAAGAIAAELNIDGFRADLLPEEKLTVSAELRAKHGRLVMVGDGVNDAPALAAADVGIAIGSIGADVALEAADIVLMNDNLEGVAWLYTHAKRTANIVRQNLILAIGVIVVLSGFALAGKIPLPIAVIGHEGSTILVAINALRLLRGGEPRTQS